MRPLNLMERQIATLLSSQDFDALVRKLIRDKEGGLATRYTEERAAAILGGSTKSKTYVYDTPEDFGYRRYDINASDKTYELKFRRDPVKRGEVKKDLWFRKSAPGKSGQRINVWYLFIDGPFGERTREEDLDRLGEKIPYLHWTWKEFLRLPFVNSV